MFWDSSELTQKYFSSQPFFMAEGCAKISAHDCRCFLEIHEYKDTLKRRYTYNSVNILRSQWNIEQKKYMDTNLRKKRHNGSLTPPAALQETWSLLKIMVKYFHTYVTKMFQFHAWMNACGCGFWKRYRKVSLQDKRKKRN